MICIIIFGLGKNRDILNRKNKLRYFKIFVKIYKIFIKKIQ